MLPPQKSKHSTFTPTRVQVCLHLTAVRTNGAFPPTLEYGGILYLQDAIAGKIAAVLGVLRKSPTPKAVIGLLHLIRADTVLAYQRIRLSDYIGPTV